jgi:hypothetical protein
MKKIGSLFLITAVIFLGVMGATNPSRDKYSNYFVRMLNLECNKQNAVLGVICTYINTTVGDSIERIVDSRTERYNWILFSVYKTQLIGQHETTAIGFLDNFMMVSKTW